jgi:hypothetical protein
MRNTMADTVQVKVGADGRVAIPGAQPGQIVTLKIIGLTETAGRTDDIGPIPEEEWAAITARVKQRARKMREELPEPWLSSNHGDLLYDDDGLPK